MKLKIGDPVAVMDEGLATLSMLMPPQPFPNNWGWVSEIDGDTVMVEFPIGNDPLDEHSQCAPYPARLVRRREGMSRDEFAAKTNRINHESRWMERVDYASRPRSGRR